MEFAVEVILIEQKVKSNPKFITSKAFAHWMKSNMHRHSEIMQIINEYNLGANNANSSRNDG